MDYGNLFVRTASGLDQYVPLPNDPPDHPSARRIHGPPDVPRPDYTWYGIHRSSFNVGIRNEDWGPVNPNSPNNPLLFYGPPSDQSWQSVLHLASVNIQLGPNFNGFTDRYGTIVTNCTAISLDCVPFVYSNMPSGESQFRGEDRQERLPVRDYDVVSPVTGKSLIKYPN
jgi:hypothetical protein